MRTLLVALFAVLLLYPTAAVELSIVDGDTIDFGEQRYRIYGIDAPEAGQVCATSAGGTWSCGKDATLVLETLVIGRTVSCDDMALDEYGRMLAVCYADGVDIGEAMIRASMAWAFRKYGDAYNEVEDAVRVDGAGIWQAETEAPWDYRAKRWQVEAQVAPEGCPIKGNINRKGERIYHVPWSPSYANTKVSVRDGERWFCDEGEAIEAGWRAAYGAAAGRPD
jgi:endonuclease YncB( thermonuclease family)